MTTESSGAHERPTLEPRPSEPVSLDPFADVDLGELEKSLRRPRTVSNASLSWIVGAMRCFALVPLFSVVWMLLSHGGERIGYTVLTELPPAPLEPGGGFGNAVLGTLLIVGL